MDGLQVSRLDPTVPAIAEAIRIVMLEAYRVEAGILGVEDFVPLRRTATAIAAADAQFLGITVAGALAAVAEVETPAPRHVHIGSLVVLPTHFRRGLATALLRHLLEAHAGDDVTVSTGIRNEPALRLYAAHGFGVHQRWTTPDGIPMVTLLRTASAGRAASQGAPRGGDKGPSDRLGGRPMTRRKLAIAVLLLVCVLSLFAAVLPAAKGGSVNWVFLSTAVVWAILAGVVARRAETGAAPPTPWRERESAFPAGSGLAPAMSASPPPSPPSSAADGVVELAPEDLPRVVDVLCAAFAGYPVMRYILAGDGADDGRLRALIRYFVAARIVRGEPLFGIEDGAALGAAITVSHPERASPAALAVLRENLWRELGDDARARYEACGRAWSAVATAAPHLYVNMVGVRPGLQGRGLARRLLEHVHRLAARPPEPKGVALTTEQPGNVGFYRHLGYQVVGEAPIAGDLRTWGLYRPPGG